MLGWLSRFFRRPLLISPTGHGVRGYDAWGGGEYGARRTHGYHKGVDFICIPGQKIIAPISGEVVRVAKPYVDWELSGIVLRSPEMEIKLFYFRPHDGLIGAYVEQGDEIGIAQDIRLKYDNRMTPHLHLQINTFDPALLL